MLRFIKRFFGKEDGEKRLPVHGSINEELSDKLYNTFEKVLEDYTNHKVEEENTKKIKAIIDHSLKESGTTVVKNELTGEYDKIVPLPDEYYQDQGLSVTPMLGDTGMEMSINEKVIHALKDMDVNSQIIDTITELLENGKILKVSYHDAATLLSTVLKKKKLPFDSAEQLAATMIGMYEGAKQDEIRIRAGYTKFYYVASIIESSRPFCVHMKNKYGGRAIDVSELEQDLNEFCPNGIPSEEEIQYETVNGVNRTEKKGFGMIKNTTVNNFSMKRGGCACRHSIRWIR